MSAQQDSRRPWPLLILKVMLVVLLTGVVGILASARFGDPQAMPAGMFRLAVRLKNPRVQPEVPVAWVRLCEAWNGWLDYLERNAPRLLETEGLWEPKDPLRAELAEFFVHARELRPEALVPEATGHTDLMALATSPPPAVLEELQKQRALDRLAEAGRRLFRLASRLENWARWAELRSLLMSCESRGFVQVAAELKKHLPPQRGSPGYNLNLTRTLKYFNELALDRDGMLRLANRWSELTRQATLLPASRNPEQRTNPDRLLDRLTDQPTLGQFADSLSSLLEEIPHTPAPAPAGKP